jgi:hypothetical protein
MVDLKDTVSDEICRTCWNIRIAVMYRVYYKSSEHLPNDSERDRTNVGMIANVAIGTMTNIPQLEISGEMLL